MLPLSNVKVLDLSRILAGPFCTMLLGDMGASVIKIEDTKGGDDTRSWAPPFVNQDALYFWSVNRNKLSVSVNFKKESGQYIIKELAKKCDVFVENFVPGSLKRYNLDYESIKAINENIVYCSISGFGQNGPWQNRPGYDVIAAGIGGMLHITGPEDGPPCRVGVAVTDLMTGMMSLSSILAALHSGRGCHLDCNLLSTQIAMLIHIGANFLTDKIEGKRIGTAHYSIVPYQAFLTKDNQYFIVGAGNNKQFQEMCSILNLLELPTDPRFSSNSQRVANRTALIHILENIFREADLKYWSEKFSNSSLPNGPVNNLENVFLNPQVKYLSDTLINSWQIDSKKISIPGFPIRCSQWNVTTPSPPPRLGEHTEKVLKSLIGYTDTDIDRLQKEGAIMVAC